MVTSNNPGPKRKGRAGVIVVAIVILLAIVVFVGMNLQHARELEQNPTPGTTQTN
ncbi:hypothetical protein [Amaricoccus sp. W119]|uniref:hypothetical protein n=1 Tax=Amaricoccus sp. W119 TaxID=3391833 RepID=UPI0039A6DAF1